MSGQAGPGNGAANRWVQLWLGVLCMVLIANLQYAWTLFVNPMHQAHGWSIAEIQIAFSIFIATETWLTPIEGYIVDHLGRTHRSAADDHLRWRAGRHRVGDQRLCRLAGDALCRRGDLRHRRRRDLRHLRRQRGEVVPRSSWPCRRPDRRGLRRRRGTHRDPDQAGDRIVRLCLRLPVVRRGAGHHPAGRRADAARSDARHGAADRRQCRGAAIGA